MCQLFALNSNTPSAITFAFTGFSARGGHTGEHVDGFGVAFHGSGGCRVFLDDAPACSSPLAAFLRQHPIRANSRWAAPTASAPSAGCCTCWNSACPRGMRPRPGPSWRR